MTPRVSDTRPHVVLMSRDDYNRARIERPQILLDPVTRIVALPLRPPDSDDPALLALGSALRPSTVLLRNTWGGNAYIDAAAAYEVISLAKFNLFANVCQMLGATRLEVSELRVVDDKGRVTASVDLRTSAAAGAGTLSSESVRKVAGSIRGLWVWQSGTGDAERASAYATAEHISGDPVIAGLIQQCRFTGNALSEHVLELDISSEAQRAVHGALQIESVLGQRFGPAFKSTLDSLREHKEQLVLRVRVVFTPPQT